MHRGFATETQRAQSFNRREWTRIRKNAARRTERGITDLRLEISEGNAATDAIGCRRLDWRFNFQKRRTQSDAPYLGSRHLKSL